MKTKFTQTTNTDGSVTIYVNGRKAFRGSPLDADSFRNCYRETATPVASAPTVGTKTKLSASHDRMTLNTTFASGDTVRLTLSHSGLTASCRQAPGTSEDRLIRKSDLRRLLELAEFRDGDKSNNDRMVRTAAVLETVSSLRELA